MTKVLIVDEDTEVLRLLRVKLSAAGYEISRARDGQEAKNLAADVQPDVVVMELLFPDMDGLELMSFLQADRSSAPIMVVLSNQTEDTDIASAFAAGAADFVTKPFSPQALLERIRVNLIRAGLHSIDQNGE